MRILLFMLGSLTITLVATQDASTTSESVQVIAGFADATNTGVPPGVTLRRSESLAINTAGAIIEGLDMQGTVTINANNVTLKNCKVTGGGWAVINITSGKTGVVI